MIPYSHTQFGFMIFGVLVAAALIGLILAVSLAEARPVLSVIAGFLIFVTLLFGSLTIKIEGEYLECRFGLGLIARRIKLADIRDAQPVRNRWWYGWGIRITPHGWLWNVSGLDAVELTYHDGKKFRLGTDEPEELAFAIRSRLRSISTP
jgi:hypothetical protein